MYMSCSHILTNLTITSTACTTNVVVYTCVQYIHACTKMYDMHICKHMHVCQGQDTYAACIPPDGTPFSSSIVWFQERPSSYMRPTKLCNHMHATTSRATIRALPLPQVSEFQKSIYTYFVYLCTSNSKQVRESFLNLFRTQDQVF